jgi:hypothetical protein
VGTPSKHILKAFEELGVKFEKATHRLDVLLRWRCGGRKACGINTPRATMVLRRRYNRRDQASAPLDPVATLRIPSGISILKHAKSDLLGCLLESCHPRLSRVLLMCDHAAVRRNAHHRLQKREQRSAINDGRKPPTRP